jgi:tetratricopeptide (TPR) repeat protein
MLIKFFKLFLILLFSQSPVYSKSKALNDHNLLHLSNYFSGLVAYENKENSEALKYFKSSKFLINQHDPFLKKYIYSLVLEGKVQHATNEIKQNLKKNNSNFFDAYLMLALDSMMKKKYKKSKDYLQKSYEFIGDDKISLIIVETLKQYLYVFRENKFLNKKKRFGNFTAINEVFQKCYLNDKNTANYFNALINNDDDRNYSRYVFFYTNYLIENNKYDEAEKLTKNLNYINSSLLISQTKYWIENQKIKEFKKIFSCKNSNDIISELFFLIANLYSSQDDYESSNFYLNISHFLNPKFSFNLTLLANNHFLNEDYTNTLKTLKSFEREDKFYYWFKLKKEAQIISKQQNKQASLNFINSEFKNIKEPSIKMIFDIANLNKNSKKYKKAIYFYDQIITEIKKDKLIYSEILYRRGSCHERIGNYKESDKDLLQSLKVNPGDAYVLNYLAYSWLEREYKINTALQMLEEAYEAKRNDPYIIDSIGWAYYLIGEYNKAENFLKSAVELMPDDPTVNDHYGDILWKLDRKIQARYFWTSVLKLKETEEEMIKIIEEKLINGLKTS